MGISIGLVGLGSFGRSFADLFHAHPLVDRVALCDLEPERMRPYVEKESWKSKLRVSDVYGNLDDIVKSDVDALVIITQPWLHAPQAVKALEHGKSVYSAVPVLMVPDGDEILEWCDRLVAAVERSGKHYMLGETTFFHADTMFCRRMAAQGAFGTFIYSEGEYLHSFDNPHCDLRKVQESRLNGSAGREWLERQRRYETAGHRGGPMFYPTHSVSGPMSVMGAHALAVSCVGTGPCSDDPYFGSGTREFSNETALFKMSNGSVMRICEHRECSASRETFRVYGTLCSYENNTWVDKFCGANNRQLTTEEMRDPLPDDVHAAFKAANPKDVYGGHGGSHAYLVHEFVDAVAHDRVPQINVREAVRYMAAGVAAHRSAQREGEWVDVADWGDMAVAAAQSRSAA